MNQLLSRKTIIIAITVILALILLISGSLVAFVLSVNYGYYGELPGKEDLQDIQHHEASSVYSADSVLLTTYFTENRTNTELDNVSPKFLQALISIEDIRFFQHSGIDFRGTMRVLIYSVMLGRDAGGGSTLTQQLAKNLFPRQNHGRLSLPISKVKEMLIARKLEEVYSKKEILTLYLNTVSFGEETFGIETAAKRFFNKSAADLNYEESALLAGVLKGPTLYHPVQNPENALQRRNAVIMQMEKYSFINEPYAKLLIIRPPGLDYNHPSKNDKPAPYFTENLRLELHELLKEQPALDSNFYNIYTDGLIIQTTIDSRMQAYANNAVKTQLKNLQSSFDRHWQNQNLFSDNDPVILREWKNSERYRRLTQRNISEEEKNELLHKPVETQIWNWEGIKDTLISPYDSIRHFQSVLQAGFMAMDAKNGNILAWVGGPEHRYFKYDQVKARRQPGSAFKPLVYAAALQNGISPCDYFRNEQLVYENFDNWTPQNINREYDGRVSVYEALSQSLNTVTISIFEEAGIKPVIELAEKSGISSTLNEVPSLALGTSSVSLIELITSYTVFANSGKLAHPHYLTAIYSRDGTLLYDFPNKNIEQQDQPISEKDAALMTAMLEKATQNGTGARLTNSFNIKSDVAGKTGTTQSNVDGWFAGYTPEIVFGARVGGMNNKVRFRTSALGSGSVTALPVTGYFLEQLNPQQQTFSQITPAIRRELDCQPHKDDRFIDRARDFFRGDEPRTTEFESEKDEDDKEWYDPRGWFGD